MCCFQFRTIVVKCNISIILSMLIVFFLLIFCSLLQGLVNVPMFHITQLLVISCPTNIWRWCETNPQKGTFTNPWWLTCLFCFWMFWSQTVVVDVTVLVKVNFAVPQSLLQGTAPPARASLQKSSLDSWIAEACHQKTMLLSGSADWSGQMFPSSTLLYEDSSKKVWVSAKLCSISLPKKPKSQCPTNAPLGLRIRAP